MTDMQTMTSDAMYTLQDVPGRGKGLVAMKRISKGTRILSEKPLVIIDGPVVTERTRTSISQQVEALSEHQRRAFLSMHNIYSYEDPVDQYIGIVRTNGLPAEVIGDRGAVFLEACRINHACNNNAQKSWNENIQRHTVHALRDIDKGDEITITYVSPLKNRELRQKILQERFDFTCTCQLCSLPPEQSQASDKRLTQIYDLDVVIDRLGTEGVLYSPGQTLCYFDRQVHLYEDHGREDVGFAQTLVGAAELTVANGDLARGRVFAERAASVWKTIVGGDSAETMESVNMSKHPSKHRLYGASRRWMTKADGAPHGLEPSDFEDWLWRREKPAALGQMANSRSLAKFTGFANLPHDDRHHPAFFESDDTGVYQPRRHWCFLGEIVGSTTIHHLEIELMDVDNRTAPLHFYTESRGNELTSPQVQSGNTVAVLYATHHVFVYGKPGIRHEDPRMMKIFPMSLHALLALSDRFDQFSVKLDGVRMCHGCGKKAASLEVCQKCASFRYCDRTCQMVGWTKKGHRVDCKLLEDPDLRGLLSFNWDEFVHPIQFPLRETKD